jgi:hypothetical protein
VSGFGITADGTCYVVQNSATGKALVRVQFSFLCAVFVWGLLVVVYAFRTMSSFEVGGKDRSSKTIKSCTIFVMAYFSTFLFPTILFFLGEKDLLHGILYPSLIYSAAITMGLQGFMNFMLWSWRILKIGACPFFCRRCFCVKGAEHSEL